MRLVIPILATILALDVGVHWLSSAPVPAGAAVGSVLLSVATWLQSLSR